MSHQKITVVTVCFNAEKTLEKTIQSVINQTYDNIEYIIIDGASTDGTLDIIKKYESKIALWKSEPDKGIYDAMNKGIKLATGDWINFINAGDVYNNCNVLSSFFKEVSKNTTIAYGDTNMKYSLGDIVWKPFALELMNNRMCFGHPATFVNVAYHKEHLYDTSYRSSADYKMLFDAYYKDKVLFQYIPQIVADFEAENGISATNSLLVARENARLRGIDTTLSWKLKYCVIYVKQQIKKIIPKSLLFAINKKHLSN